MDAASKEFVRQRANHRCEYCRTQQKAEPFFRYQVEHIIAKQHGGGDDLDNLALACPNCNLHKGPNVAGIDVQTGTLTPLFNPRTQDWDEHFFIVREEGAMVGKTSTGRVTVQLLNINDPLRCALRRLAS